MVEYLTSIKQEHQGLSTDPKPTEGVPPGSLYLAVDTFKGYVYSPGNIDAEKAPDGWWPIV